LRWHPARLLYLFVVTLLVGIIYSEVQALLTDPASAIDPSQLRKTLFWQAAATHPLSFVAACVLAVGAAILGWRLDRRYAAQQAQARREETVAVAEQVVQRAQAGGMRATRTVPHDLPPRAHGFVGRQEDLAQITAALRQAQVVAIVGMGGLGKSALAAEAVARLAQEHGAFPGGVTWVRCDERTGLEGATWIADQLLTAWGAALPAEATARAATPEEGLAVREQALRKRLGSEPGAASSSTLILLDNLEAGLPLARLLDTLEPLQVTALLTSRIEPSSQRVRLCRLDVLDPDAGVQLFAERYANRGGQWDAARDKPAAESIVAALGGLPLAIELAAARAARTRLSLLTLAEEVRAPDALVHLSDPLDPSAGVRYSLRKTLLALSPSQRIRFAGLGLPEGADWPLPVVERLLDGVPPTYDGSAPAPAAAQADLEALVAYTLVGLTASEEGEVQRVRLHPLVRELAREEFAQQPDALQRAALGGLLAGVHDWVTKHATDYDLLAHDEDLIAGILRAAARHQIDVSLVISCIETFDQYLHIRNRKMRQDVWTLVLSYARAMKNGRGEITALRKLISTTGYLGLNEENRQYTQEALASARAVGDPFLQAVLLSEAAQHAAEDGRLDEARNLYTESLQLARTIDAGANAFDLFLGLGRAAAFLREYREAVAFFERALTSARAAGYPGDLTIALHNLAEVTALLGDDATARAYHEEVLNIARRVGAPTAIAVCLDSLGEIALRARDATTAISLFREALRLFESSDDAQMIAHASGNLAAAEGEAARLRGDTGEAQRHFQEALRIFEGAKIPYSHYARDYEDFVRERLASLQN
jgi:tetratricopeptide (TPR) repeat protein